MIKILPFCLLLLPLILLALIPLNRKMGRWETLALIPPWLQGSIYGLASCNGKLYLLTSKGGWLIVAELDWETLEWSEPGVETRGAKTGVAEDGEAETMEAGSLEAVGLGDIIILPMAGMLIYEPDRGFWTKGADCPAGRNRKDGATVEYGDRLYLVGGTLTDKPGGPTRFFDEYDPVTDSWKSLPNMPHSRSLCTAAVLKDRLYVAGRVLGQNGVHAASGAGAVPELDCYDFRTGRWSVMAAGLPAGSGEGRLAGLDDRLYYIGRDSFQLCPESGKPWTLAEGGNRFHEGDGPSPEGAAKSRKGVVVATAGHALYVARSDSSSLERYERR